jgi:hypothetical protein
MSEVSETSAELKEINDALNNSFPEDSIESDMAASGSDDEDLTDEDEVVEDVDDGDVGEALEDDDEAEGEEHDSDEETSEAAESGEYGDDEDYPESGEAESDGESVNAATFDDDDLSTLVQNPYTGEVLSLEQVFKGHVSHAQWRERTRKVRQEERSKAQQEVSESIQPLQGLAMERQAIERDFTTAPIEFALGSLQRAVQLGIAPPQAMQEFQQAVARLEQSGVYNRQAAQMQAFQVQQQQQVQHQQQQTTEVQANAWVQHQDALFMREFGTSFFELPADEQMIVRGAFQQDPGSPNLADIYRGLFGEGGRFASAGSTQSEVPVESNVVERAPTTAPSQKKLIRKLKKQRRGKPSGRSGGASGSGKGKKDSMQSVNSDLDRAMGLS